MTRNYVIVCNEHTNAKKAGELLFWGFHTENDEERSFGGYTTDIDKCEKYTRQELEEWRGDNTERIPFYDEIKGNGLAGFFKCEDVMISQEDLYTLGFRKKSVMRL